MSEKILTGTLLNRRSDEDPARVVAVGPDQTILSESRVGPEGVWSLPVAGSLEWLVAQTGGKQLVSAAVRPAEPARIALPDSVPLEFEFAGAEGFAALWLDAVELQGFPDELLWVLRAHTGNILDLHQAELRIPAEAVNLEVQPGRYRLSGGRFSITDELVNTNLRLASALDQRTGTVFESEQGVLVLDIFQPSGYLLTFAPA
ncbi:MAG TPA: hypothetical protein VGB17_18865 [Pyrinomonadaceae bacterium]